MTQQLDDDQIRTLLSGLTVEKAKEAVQIYGPVLSVLEHEVLQTPHIHSAYMEDFQYIGDDVLKYMTEADVALLTRLATNELVRREIMEEIEDESP